MENLKKAKALNRNDLRTINGGASSCNRPGGERPCCEYRVEGNSSSGCRVRAVCAGGSFQCP